MTPNMGWESMAAPSLSPSPQILEKKKLVLTHLVYLQMKGAVVNYFHPFLGPGELGSGGNTHSQAGRLERHWLRFTSAHQNPLPALKPAPGAVKQQKKPRKSLQRTARIKLNRLLLKV